MKKLNELLENILDVIFIDYFPITFFCPFFFRDNIYYLSGSFELREIRVTE